mgnify:CR=1 FL=1
MDVSGWLWLLLPQAVKDSKKHGWGVMTSHRSGETEDNYIADLAVSEDLPPSRQRGGGHANRIASHGLTRCALLLLLWCGCVVVFV